MQSLLDKQPHRLKSLAYDFTEKFIESLEELSIQIEDDSILDELVYEKIEASTPLKDDFTTMLRLLCDAEVLESDFIVDFFEKIMTLTEFSGSGRVYELQFDHYKFIITELYLHTSMILLERRLYQVFSEVVNSDYFIDTRNYSGRGAQGFTAFKFHIQSLEQRNSRLELRKFSLQAHTLITRAGKQGKDLVEAELILYYITKTQNNDRRGWYPTTHIYFKDGSHIKILGRLKSTKHFEAVKDIFSSNTAEELKNKINGIQYDSGYSGSFEHIPRIQEFINPDEIAINP
jgi:hypothetical protein